MYDKPVLRASGARPRLLFALTVTTLRPEEEKKKRGKRMREGAGLFPPLRFYQQPTMTNRAPVLSLRDPALEHRHPPTARPISSSLDWSVNVFSRHSSVLTCTRIGEAAHDTIQVSSNQSSIRFCVSSRMLIINVKEKVIEKFRCFVFFF